MILSFKTHIEKRPTKFTNKIVKWMWENYSLKMSELVKSQKMPDYYVFEPMTVYEAEIMKPKLHTIREDKNDRWKVGMIIDFFIYPRNIKMFRFAPKVPVKGIQKIEIAWDEFMFQKIPHIFIDGMKILDKEKIKQIAQNDGFPNESAFFKWFNKDFTGKILHWSDLKY